ncbi:hypothetical protein ACXWPL_09810, partial [Streptococcus pyogenes]
MGNTDCGRHVRDVVKGDIGLLADAGNFARLNRGCRAGFEWRGGLLAGTMKPLARSLLATLAAIG